MTEKVRIRITEHLTGRTLALTKPLDEATAHKFIDDFYEYFCDSPVVNVNASIEEVDE